MNTWIRSKMKQIKKDVIWVNPSNPSYSRKDIYIIGVIRIIARVIT